MNAPQNPKDVQAIWHQRVNHHAPRFAVMDEIEAAVKGNTPARFNDWFDSDDIKPEIRMIRTADDDLTALCSKEFPVYVNPKTQSQDNRKAAERVEKIAYSWNSGASFLGGPEMDAIMHALSRYQVRFADGVLCVYPDFNTRTLHFSVRDPRTHLPPVNWTPWSTHGLDDTLFSYKETLGNLKQRFPDKAAVIDATYQNSSFGPGGSRIPNDSTIVNVGEFYSRGAWYSVILDDKVVTLARSEEGDRFHPGVCPVTSFQQFSSDPLFAGQVGLEVAMNKVLLQNIQGTDKMLHGPIVGPPIVGGFRHDGYNEINTAFGPTPQIQRLAPDSSLNTDRQLNALIGLARILNRNPESFQGAGGTGSAKETQLLQSGVRSTVQDVLWIPFISGFPKVYANCAEMEQNLWPNERKTVTGKKGKTSFEVDYIPSVHLEGYEHRIKIEPGLGLGGFQQILDLEQRKSAGLLSKRTFMEMVPDIRDAELELTRIDSESVDDLIRAVIESKGPTLNISGLLEVKRLVDEKEMSLADAFQQVANAGMLEQPPPEQAVPPGMPPELAALMGGAASPEVGVPPGLAEIRAG